MWNSIVENVTGFFALGSKDFSNRVRILAYTRKIRKLKDQIRELNRKLGRESWEKGFIDSQTFPTAENLERFEAQTAEKRSALDAIEKELAELRERRKSLITHYQTKMKEQLDLKKPVDDELSELQVEIKRIKREIKGAHHEMKTLQQKGDLKQKRLRDFESTNTDTNKYLRSEIESEWNLNKRFYELKKENIILLEKNLASFKQQEQKVQTVIQQFEQQIEDLKQNQKETIFKIRQNMENLQQRKYDLEEQIQKIRVEMSPVLEKLGEQITMRRIQSEKLHKHYKKMDSLEDRLENQREKREKCKRECGSISFALKVGYYGFLFACIAAVVVGIALILT